MPRAKRGFKARRRRNRILKHADRIYVIRNGHIQLHGTAAELADGETIKRAYFGFGEAATADAVEEDVA